MKTLNIILLGFFFPLFLSAQQAIPDFTVTDLNGNEHRLYEDYLDKGMGVIINISAAWSPPDFQWHETGVLEDLYHQYGQGGSGEIAVLHIESDPSTTDDMLTGEHPNALGDWTEGRSYPICNPTEEEFDIINEFNLVYFPNVLVVCPDGIAYTDGGVGAEFAEVRTELGWGNLSVEFLADFAFSNCDIATDRNKVTATVYQDTNMDCMEDDNEMPLPSFKATFSNDNGLSYCRYSNDNGELRTFLETGEYQLNVSPPNNLWAVCNPDVDINFTSINEELDLAFGGYGIQDCHSPTISITSPALIRCFDSQIYVYYCNEGTIAADDATIEVTLDEHMSPISASTPWDNVNGNILTFNIGELLPFQCGQIQITVLMDCDEIELGQEHCYSATISPEDDCVDPTVGPGGAYTSYNTDSQCQPNVGSYDPNDKRGFPLGVGDNHDILPNTDIDYQIRFQNSGTFTAFNIVVLDTLPAELDASSIRLGSRSHAYDFAIIDGNVLEFTFTDINLPWEEVDEPGSNGFVNFKIRQKVDLPEQTRIENRAAIYFDFNDPIITNTSLHTINSNLVSVDNSIAKLNNISLSPNPVQERLFVQYELEERAQLSIEVYNILGELVEVALPTQVQSQGQQQLSLDFKNYIDGLYFIHFKTDKGSLIKKVVK